MSKELREYCRRCTTSGSFIVYISLFILTATLQLQIPGVHRVDVQFSTKEAYIWGASVSGNELVSAVEDVGFDATVIYASKSTLQAQHMVENIPQSLDTMSESLSTSCSPINASKGPTYISSQAKAISVVTITR